ncbi:MAG: bifunctional (p)ppGpp synthetase/guanosine-3',5'-bis(diphosphate) 3'-pyrophosphohydrolase [Gemmatimonadota bacterium]|nr:MAG: bifunctional (p)ppGpp synthetase/guanosine-3',5'-bis(diphosphate) 3'-pyrophosphohydrolase [Gemmatimonadota bacterium]
MKTEIRCRSELSALLNEVKSSSRIADLDFITHAYRFSEMAHKDQSRKSGHRYMEHCIEVARILAGLHLDSVTIAAGLLHDVVEDTKITVEHVREEFGEEIAELVDGVTKIGELKFQSREEQQAENFRKMLLSMAQDIRVILIKFADRLHNMRTLEHLGAEKARRIAQETMDVYAPLAHRFGMWRIKWELEDLSLKYIDPEAYGELEAKVSDTREEREQYIQEVEKPLTREFKKPEIKARIYGRAKHFQSIHLKITQRNVPFEEIQDLLAIRVIVPTVQDCYHALGVVHTLYTPVQDRFDDYIATPKSNMYQSLHTTVIGPRGKMVEIQIRTEEMHRIAEEGIAAHWRYKEGKKKEDELDQHMRWVRQLVDWQVETPDPKEFLESLKIDLFQREVFVFTPQGDLIRLPRGSTPIDFAFAVHSEVGYHCSGARVNGRFVPLSTPLQSGVTVEIITSPSQKPNQDWLNLVQTPRARGKIRAWIKVQFREQSVKLGEEIVERELKKHRIKKIPKDDLLGVAQDFGFFDLSSLYAALGTGDLSVLQVVHKLLPPKEQRAKESLVGKVIERARRSPTGVQVEGVDNLMIRLAKCCHPLPGDHILGYVTRGRGISIHRIDCPNRLQLMSEADRRVPVQWHVDKDQSFLTGINVVAEDRKGLLGDLSEAIADTDTNIQSAKASTVNSRASTIFVLEVANLQQLRRVMKKVKRVQGVLSVERLSELESA